MTLTLAAPVAEACAVLHVAENEDYGTAPVASDPNLPRAFGTTPGLCRQCRRQGHVTVCRRCGGSFCVRVRPVGRL